MRAVSDAGPLIRLSWLDQLELLARLFDEVLVPGAVREEVLRAGPGVLGIASLHTAFTAGQVRVREVIDTAAAATLTATLHRGEAEAIVLMREEQADLLLLDDRLARDEAERRGLPIAGTIGLLRRARERGFIGAVVPLVEELRRRGFWVSAGLLERLRREEEVGGQAAP